MGGADIFILDVRDKDEFGKGSLKGLSASCASSNAAIGGAKLAMISTEMRRRAEIVARETRHVQIAERGDFQTLFADAMMFE